MAITQDQAQAQLDIWLQASIAVAGNQSYQIGQRQFTKADAGEIRQMIDFWEKKVDKAATGRATGVRIRGITVSS